MVLELHSIDLVRHWLRRFAERRWGGYGQTEPRTSAYFRNALDNVPCPRVIPNDAAAR